MEATLRPSRLHGTTSTAGEVVANWRQKLVAAAAVGAVLLTGACAKPGDPDRHNVDIPARTLVRTGPSDYDRVCGYITKKVLLEAQRSVNRADSEGNASHGFMPQDVAGYLDPKHTCPIATNKELWIRDKDMTAAATPSPSPSGATPQPG